MVNVAGGGEGLAFGFDCIAFSLPFQLVRPFAASLATSLLGARCKVVDVGPRRGEFRGEMPAGEIERFAEMAEARKSGDAVEGPSPFNQFP